MVYMKTGAEIANEVIDLFLHEYCLEVTKKCTQMKLNYKWRHLQPI